MAGGMRTDVAELAGIVVEGVLLGIFLVLDIAAIYILVVRPRRYTRLNIPMLVAAIVMMLLALAQYIVDTANIFIGFISLGDESRIARSNFFSDLTHPLFAAKHAIYFTMMLVGDAIAIYRCYIVWDSQILVVIVPILCSLGSAGCAYQTVWAVRHFPAHPSFETVRFERNMGFAIFGLSFGANAISTSLLAFKIWKADHNLRKFAQRQTTRQVNRIPIIRIIAESGAVNTAYLLVYTIVLENGTSGIQIVACIVTPLVGIIFATVIIRASLVAESQAKLFAENEGFPRRLQSFTDRDPGLPDRELKVISTGNAQKLPQRSSSFTDSL